MGLFLLSLSRGCIRRGVSETHVLGLPPRARSRREYVRSVLPDTQGRGPKIRHVRRDEGCERNRRQISWSAPRPISKSGVPVVPLLGPIIGGAIAAVTD